MRGRSRLRSFCLAPAILAAASTSAASDEPGPAEQDYPAVVVSFEGGVVGDNVSSVLSAIAASPQGLPTEAYAVKLGDTICDLLDQKRFPKPCPNFGKIIDFLNPETRPFSKPLKAGQTIKLPAIKMDRYIATNAYSKEVPEQATRAQNQLKNYKDLNIKKFEYGAQRIVVEYYAYEMTIQTKDDASAIDLAERLDRFRSMNVSVDVLESEKKQPTPLHAAPSLAEIQSFCSSNTLGDGAFDYVSVADADRDALAVINASRPPPLPVNVHIVDVPMTMSPNLGGGNEPSWTCKWGAFKKGLHHSTHLAGIIGSKATKFGFKGLAPNAKLIPFVWAVPAADGEEALPVRDAERAKLRRVIDSDNSLVPLPVYLAATQFDLPKGMSSDAPIVDVSKKFNIKIAEVIRDRRPLLIVAAGQLSKKEIDAGKQAQAIDGRTPLSPQHLGDLENVVVVTACTDCGRHTAKLLDIANYNREGEFFVHVAAPGGSDLPGWISASEIGAAPGTSQASAYVAGVATAMIGSYPEKYGDPSRVKTRLQVTSRPFDADIGGDVTADQRKIVAGVVDPILAMLDPSKTWLKDAGGWREVKFKEWANAELEFETESGTNFKFESPEVLRATRISGPGGQRYWSIYRDRLKRGEVERIGPVNLEGSAALVLCDGSKIDLALDGVVDFIAPIGGVSSNACS